MADSSPRWSGRGVKRFRSECRVCLGWNCMSVAAAAGSVIGGHQYTTVQALMPPMVTSMRHGGL